MIIVLDTNILFSDFHLEGSKIRTLCQSADKTGLRVFLPQIVIDETKNKYSEEIEAHKAKIDKEISSVNKLTKSVHNTSFNETFIKKELNKYNKEFDEKIYQLGINKIPYTQTTHQTIAHKAIKKIKPFTESGKGYRDALIWENIKELLKSGTTHFIKGKPLLVFVTKNYRDFCSDKFKLHDDLTEDLRHSGLKSALLEIKDDIDQVIEEYIKPELKLLTNIQLKFSALSYPDIFSEIENLLNSFLLFSDVEPHLLGFPIEYETTTISSIDDEYEFSVTDVRQLSPKELFISLNVKVSCSFDVFIFKSDYLIMDESRAPKILDNDWNDHYFLAIDQKDIELQLLLTVNSKISRIISNEIEITGFN